MHRSSSSSPSFKEALSAVISGFHTKLPHKIKETDNDERLVTELTARDNFRFPPPLMSDDASASAATDSADVSVSVSVRTRFRAIHKEPRPNTLNYLLLSQYNPWLDCEMTREKRAYLKPHIGEVSCAVSAAAAAVFRNETAIDIANLYLWPLLHSHADEVVACRTFSDWRRLFARTITIAFPDYNDWVAMTATRSSAFVSVSDRNRYDLIIKSLNPARVLFLITTQAGFWPYGPLGGGGGGGGARLHRWSLSLSLSSSVSVPHPVSGLCSIKQKIKEYSDATEIEWLVRADFLRKMKRVHLYITQSASAAAASASPAVLYYADSE